MSRSELSPNDRELREWIREYTPRLLPVARAFADTVDDAEDLLQELWIVAHEHADRRPAGTPLVAWLHTVLLNIGRSRFKRRRRRERLMSLWGGATHDMANTASVDIDGAIARGRLWRRVAELPSLQREVLLLRIVEDLSVAQTAQRLARAEGTVKGSLHRALKTLHTRITDAR